MNRSWDIYMVGTLANTKEIDGGIYKDSVFINKYNSLQFYIKVISQSPENFPEVRFFTGYTSDLQNLSFQDDDNMLSEEERIQALKDFFDTNLIIFNPIQKGDNFFISNVIQVVRPNNISTYIPVPLFRNNNLYRTFDEFKQALFEKNYMDEIHGISHEQIDTPSILVWEEDNRISNIIGSFTNQLFIKGKIKFDFEFFKFIEFKEIWSKNIILTDQIKNVIFIGQDIYTVMENTLQEMNSYEDEKIKNGNKINSRNEADFIKNFSKHTKEAALLYNEGDLINFHTAMKSSNLVILAGMSGTGKSKLVQMYGEALGLNSSQLNIIPVRPSWCDDRDLLGYVDSIHNIYKPGDSGLIDTLIQANENSDKLYIICFDEMNLAKVEHYFSQFLSILEMDPANRKIKLYNKDLENSLYNYVKYKSEIEIRDNVLFVGTVNIDESTYNFSDKVLDRANVITLNTEEDLKKIKSLKLEKKVKCDEVMFSEYKEFIVPQTEITLSDLELDLFNELHREINKCNKNIGIGFRIIKQIDSYLRNLPENEILTRREGMDLQLVQRVLTKVRGPQDQIISLLGNYDIEKDEVSESRLIYILNKYTEISDFKKSIKCIKEKAKELSIYGYAI